MTLGGRLYHLRSGLARLNVEASGIRLIAVGLLVGLASLLILEPTAHRNTDTTTERVARIAPVGEVRVAANAPSAVAVGVRMPSIGRLARQRTVRVPWGEVRAAVDGELVAATPTDSIDWLDADEALALGLATELGTPGGIAAVSTPNCGRGLSVLRPVRPSPTGRNRVETRGLPALRRLDIEPSTAPGSSDDGVAGSAAAGGRAHPGRPARG